MPKPTLITEVQDFINRQPNRSLRKTYTSYFNNLFKKNASRSHQLLTLEKTIADLDTAGTKHTWENTDSGSTATSSSITCTSGDETPVTTSAAAS